MTGMMRMDGIAVSASSSSCGDGYFGAKCLLAAYYEAIDSTLNNIFHSQKRDVTDGNRQIYFQ